MQTYDLKPPLQESGLHNARQREQKERCTVGERDTARKRICADMNAPIRVVSAHLRSDFSSNAAHIHACQATGHHNVLLQASNGRKAVTFKLKQASQHASGCCCLCR